MLTDDEERAEEVARELDLLNRDRRETEQRILHAAEAACADQMSAAALVVAGEGWHPGVVGIVASRLVERHRRPCVVIGLDGGAGRGSARSIAPYDLHAGLGAAGAHLTRFGGHRMAAGLEIDAGAIPAFRAALAAHAGERLSPEDLRRVQPVDAVVPGGSLNLELAEELERLGPFGQANPAPVLMVPGARIEHVTAMGEERDHARFSLASGGARARGVAFRTSQRALAEAGRAPQDVSVSLERNRWNGAVEARVVLRSLTDTRAGHRDRRGAGAILAGGGGRAHGRPRRVVARDRRAVASPRREGPPRRGPGGGGGRPAHQRRRRDAGGCRPRSPPGRARAAAWRACPRGASGLRMGRSRGDRPPRAPDRDRSASGPDGLGRAQGGAGGGPGPPRLG